MYAGGGQKRKAVGSYGANDFAFVPELSRPTGEREQALHHTATTGKASGL